VSQLTEAEALYRAVRQELTQLPDVRLDHRYRRLREQTDSATGTNAQLVELAALRHAMQARGLEVPG
jgi:hypothetical protein